MGNSHMVPLSVLARKQTSKPTPFPYPTKGSMASLSTMKRYQFKSESTGISTCPFGDVLNF